MSYQYTKRSSEELEQIASVILDRFKKRRIGDYVDVEGIAEDCDLLIIPRGGGLRDLVEGYVAANPHYILIPQQLSEYLPKYRPVIGEELCHIILEYDVLNTGGKLPQGAEPHDLTPQQFKDIEEDARYLSRAVLMPKAEFTKLFEAALKKQTTNGDRGLALRNCVESLDTSLQIFYMQVAYRARDLGLMTEDECSKNFSNRLKF